MRIKPHTLQHWIENFYGYGSWNAPVWFVSHEEGGGEFPEDVAEKLDYFYAHHRESTLCDIRELYRHLTFRYEGPKAALYDTHYAYRFGPDAVQNYFWKNLTAFASAFRNEAIPDTLLYQRQSFASSALRREALIRLFPLPAAHNHAWYYNWLDLPEFPFLKSRSTYEQALFDKRIQTILSKIREYNPSLVLMYGMSNINMLKASVANFFPETVFRSVKAVRQHTPQHHLARLTHTTLVITTQIPGLRHNRVETGFDWYAFGKMLSES